MLSQLVMVTWGSNMRFFTSTNGSANGIERLRITSNGTVNIGGDLAQTTHRFLVDKWNYFI